MPPGPLWVVEKYNAFPIDCGTVQEAKCQIEAEALYAKGPRPNGMAMLRLFSSIEPYWVSVVTPIVLFDDGTWKEDKGRRACQWCAF